jgi:hypothetical protein
MTRFPTPNHFETSAMPTQDGLRLNHLHRVKKARQSPEQFAWLFAFQRDLMQVGLTEAPESPLQPVPWSDYRQQLQATAKRGTCLRPNDLSILG